MSSYKIKSLIKKTGLLKDFFKKDIFLNMCFIFILKCKEISSLFTRRLKGTSGGTLTIKT